MFVTNATPRKTNATKAAFAGFRSKRKAQTASQGRNSQNQTDQTNRLQGPFPNAKTVCNWLDSYSHQEIVRVDEVRSRDPEMSEIETNAGANEPIADDTKSAESVGAVALEVSSERPSSRTP